MRSAGGSTASSRSGPMYCSVWCLPSHRASSVDVQPAVLDEVAHAAEAESCPEGAHGVTDDGGLRTGPHGGSPWHVEHGADLAEVVTRGDDLEQFLTAACQFTDDFE